MILTATQAQAVHAALTTLNEIQATPVICIAAERAQDEIIINATYGDVQIRKGQLSGARESHAGHAAFAAAYGLA